MIRRLLAVLLVLVAVVAIQAHVRSRSAPAAAPLTPDDPGTVSKHGGWVDAQWNFAGRYGVDAPHAWGNLVAAGAPGGAGVTVAVLDTGVAYPVAGSSRLASPDLRRTAFVPGYDFVDEDAVPFDETGHGTHVASTIAEQTDNGYGLTGLAYGVRIMPVRILDRSGAGDVRRVARGVRFAADHGAKVINLSLSFELNVRARELQPLFDAIEYAHDRGTVIVAGTGNSGADRPAFPALNPNVIAVGATTDDGCLARYSNHGTGIDVVAPGGGRDASFRDDPLCRPGRRGLPIYQITRKSPAFERFGVTGFIGTSMAAPHVSAIAALVIASGVLGRNPSPDAVQRRIVETTRDLGAPGYDSRYGWGLVNAAAATAPRSS